MKRFVVRRRAARDLHDILIYSAREWGLDRAERYILDIHAAFERLLVNSELSSTISLPRGVYRRSNVGSHAIVFTVSDDTVAILRVLHQRRDIPKHLR